MVRRRLVHRCSVMNGRAVMNRGGVMDRRGVVRHGVIDDDGVLLVVDSLVGERRVMVDGRVVVSNSLVVDGRLVVVDGVRVGMCALVVSHLVVRVRRLVLGVVGLVAQLVVVLVLVVRVVRVVLAELVVALVRVQVAVLVVPGQLGVQGERARREGGDRLVLAVHRLALNQQAAQQHPERLGVGQADAPVGGRHELLEMALQLQARDEVVDERQRAEALGAADADDPVYNPDGDPAGSWVEPWFTGTGFPKVFYLRYHLYRLYFPLMALGRFLAARTGDDEQLVKLRPRVSSTESVS